MIILEFMSKRHFSRETGIYIFDQKTISKQVTSFTKNEEVFYKLLSKQPDLTNYPNVIGELLCPIILERIGIRSLTVESIFFIQPDLWILEFPYIGSQRSFTGFQVASSFTLKELLKLEYSDFWKLFIFDVITGNGDRNLKNFFRVFWKSCGSF